MLSPLRYVLGETFQLVSGFTRFYHLPFYRSSPGFVLGNDSLLFSVTIFVLACTVDESWLFYLTLVQQNSPRQSLQYK